MNRSAYEFTTAETIFMFILIPVVYFRLIGLICLEIKLINKTENTLSSPKPQNSFEFNFFRAQR